MHANSTRATLGAGAPSVRPRRIRLWRQPLGNHSVQKAGRSPEPVRTPDRPPVRGPRRRRTCIASGGHLAIRNRVVPVNLSNTSTGYINPHTDEEAKAIVDALLDKAIRTLQKSHKFNADQALRTLTFREGVDPNHSVLQWLDQQFQDVLGYRFQFMVDEENEVMQLVCLAELNFSDPVLASISWWAYWRLKKRDKRSRQLQRLYMLNLLLLERSISGGICNTYADGYGLEDMDEMAFSEMLDEIQIVRRDMQHGKVKELVKKKQAAERTDAYAGIYADLRNLSQDDNFKDSANLMYKAVHLRRVGHNANTGRKHRHADSAEDWFLELKSRYSKLHYEEELSDTVAQLIFELSNKEWHHHTAFKDCTDLKYITFEDFIFGSCAATLEIEDHHDWYTGEEDGEFPSVENLMLAWHNKNHLVGDTECISLLDLIGVTFNTDDLLGRSQINHFNSTYQEGELSSPVVGRYVLPDGTLPVMSTGEAEKQYLDAVYSAVRAVDYGNELVRDVLKLSKQIEYFHGYTGCQETCYAEVFDFKPWFDNTMLYRRIFDDNRKQVWTPPKPKVPKTLVEVFAEAEQDANTPDFMRVDNRVFDVEDEDDDEDDDDYDEDDVQWG
jgi:hypothetical protein